VCKGCLTSRCVSAISDNMPRTMTLHSAGSRLFALSGPELNIAPFLSSQIALISYKLQARSSRRRSEDFTIVLDQIRFVTMGGMCVVGALLVNF
jgi:hypothetical protein